MTPPPTHGPTSAPAAAAAAAAAAGFAFEVRLWWPRLTGPEAGWVTAAWCSTMDYAELLAEAAMSPPGCLYAEVWGPSQRVSGTRVPLLRYDLDATDGS